MVVLTHWSALRRRSPNCLGSADVIGHFWTQIGYQRRDNPSNDAPSLDDVNLLVTCEAVENFRPLLRGLFDSRWFHVFSLYGGVHASNRLAFPLFQLHLILRR